MNTNLLIIFIVLNVVNVIIQTVKTIATVKCGKTVAAIVNAVTYALYTVVLVYTMCDLPLWAKALLTLLLLFECPCLELEFLLLSSNQN